MTDPLPAEVCCRRIAMEPPPADTSWLDMEAVSPRPRPIRWLRNRLLIRMRATLGSEDDDYVPVSKWKPINSYPLRFAEHAHDLTAIANILENGERLNHAAAVATLRRIAADLAGDNDD